MTRLRDEPGFIAMRARKEALQAQATISQQTIDLLNQAAMLSNRGERMLIARNAIAALLAKHGFDAVVKRWLELEATP